MMCTAAGLWCVSLHASSWPHLRVLQALELVDDGHTFITNLQRIIHSFNQPTCVSSRLLSL